VYPLIRGTPLVAEDEAGVRAFLTALHALRPETVPAEDWVAAYHRQCGELGRLVVPLLDVDERPAAAALFAEVETLTGFTPPLVHGDLLPEHLLVRDGRLAGVIDWGDARIGDPALDYTWFLHGPFPHWDVGEDLRRRARFYHRLAPFFSVHYGVLTGRPEYTERALATLRARL
jgi:aminoglycoside phosphotransferase (APT) family kinase protein